MSKVIAVLWFAGVGSVVGGCFVLAQWLGLIASGVVLAGHAWVFNEIQHRTKAKAKDEAK